MSTFTNFTDVNIETSAKIAGLTAPSATLASPSITGTATVAAANFSAKANIIGALTVTAAPVYTWTNTNANFADVCNAIAQIKLVIKGLA